MLLAINRACVGKRYDIRPYFPCSNLLINIFCPACSICQIHNELRFQNERASEELDFVEEHLDVIVVQPMNPVEGLNSMTRKYIVVEPSAPPPEYSRFYITWPVLKPGF